MTQPSGVTNQSPLSLTKADSRPPARVGGGRWYFVLTVLSAGFLAAVPFWHADLWVAAESVTVSGVEIPLEPVRDQPWRVRVSQSREDLRVWVDGVPMGGGIPRLVVPSDARGGRYIPYLTSLEVREAAP